MTKRIAFLIFLIKAFTSKIPRLSAGTSETRLLVLLMIVVAALSAFMSNTGAVAIFIPVAMNLAVKAGVPAHRLLMPLAPTPNVAWP